MIMIMNYDFWDNIKKDKKLSPVKIFIICIMTTARLVAVRVDWWNQVHLCVILFHQNVAPKYIGNIYFYMRSGFVLNIHLWNTTSICLEFRLWNFFLKSLRVTNPSRSESRTLKAACTLSIYNIQSICILKNMHLWGYEI